MRTCLKCRTEFDGMGVYVFEKVATNPFFRRTPYIMCIDCGGDGGNIVAPFPYSGAISTGTLRTADLMSAFMPIVRRLDPERHATLAVQWPADAEEEMELLVEVMDVLDLLAPPGYYFGTLEGDGAAYGFWEMDNEECKA